MTARRAERHIGNHEDSRHEVLTIKVMLPNTKITINN